MTKSLSSSSLPAFHHLTLRQLRIFSAAAREQSYTRAAESLHLTQPAVSMQINQLENLLDLKLFEHQHKKVQLTQAGAILYRYCGELEATLRSAEKALQPCREGEQAKLSLAVVSSVSQFAAKALGEFSRSHPDVRVALDVVNREQILTILEQGDKDLVLMGQPPNNKAIKASAFMSNPLVIIAASNYHLRGHPLNWTDIIDEPFLLREQASGTRQALDRLLQERQLTLSNPMLMNHDEAIKQCVSQGLGLALVSQHSIEEELKREQLVTLEIEGLPLYRQWYFAYRSDQELAPTAQLFCDFLRVCST